MGTVAMYCGYMLGQRDARPGQTVIWKMFRKPKRARADMNFKIVTTAS